MCSKSAHLLQYMVGLIQKVHIRSCLKMDMVCSRTLRLLKYAHNLLFLLLLYFFLRGVAAANSWRRHSEFDINTLPSYRLRTGTESYRFAASVNGVMNTVKRKVCGQYTLEITQKRGYKFYTLTL